MREDEDFIEYSYEEFEGTFEEALARINLEIGEKNLLRETLQNEIDEAYRQGYDDAVRAERAHS